MCIHVFFPTRYEDFDPKTRAKIKHHRVISLIPPICNDDGTTSEPSCLDGFLLPTLWELQRLGPKPSEDVPTHAFGPLGLPRKQIGEVVHAKPLKLVPACFE